MLSRTILTSIALLACAGCSDTATTLSSITTASLQPQGISTGGLQAFQVPAGGAATLATVGQDDDADRLRSSQKTMASKVLAAMALERVTGRKADPGRLAEAN